MAAKVLRRMDTAGHTEEFPLPKSRYGFGVSWDCAPGRPQVDIDLQCLVVDTGGAIIDCAYYNNLKAVGCITHSGDEPTGAIPGIDEMVWVNCAKVPPKVQLLIFVVAAYSGGCLRDVANGVLHIFEESKSAEIARFEMERSEGSVDVVAAMFRGSGGWTMRIIDEPARQGQHFMDILPLIADVVRVFIPSAPKRQKVAFAVEKGGILDLPQDLSLVTVGLGWDTDAGEVDVDVSAVLLDGSGMIVEAVFFGNLESVDHGIVHSGDNLTGEGAGDDEQIKVPLSRIGPAVQQVVFVINVYTPKMSFQQIANPYCRVVDGGGAELCRYALRDAGHENGLIVSKLAREAGGRWGFHALGVPCRGRNYKDSVHDIQRVCVMDTRKLMARGGTVSMDAAAFGPPAGADPRQAMHRASAPVATAPPTTTGPKVGPPRKSADCVCQ